jgi:hypothetical protein
MKLSRQFEEALVYATRIHGGQLCKQPSREATSRQGKQAPNRRVKWLSVEVTAEAAIPKTETRKL